jgi:signal peptide peptidase SppA
LRLVDILTSPWAIVPEKLLEIQAIYRTHLRGDKIDLGALEAKLGHPLANDPKPYEVVNGVAVIEMEGIVAKRMSLFTKISGGISTYHVQQQFANAMADRKVQAILLNIDSPGGGIDGTAELAGMIHASRGSKPIVAWTDGMLASAAYWIGSAADAVYVSGDTAQVGSIGVVASHMDISEAEKMMGIKTTEIVAGKYKRIASRHAPLSKEGKATIQEMVDHVYSAFVADVAKHRGVSEEQVLEQMADGRIFVGRQAVNAGLVDGVSTMEELIGKLSAGDLAAGKPVAAGAAATAIEDIKEDPMKVKVGEETIDVQDALEIDAKWISENCPDIATSFRSEGAAAERERIQGIEEAALPGYERIVAEAKADGKSTGADVAFRIVKAENQVRAKKLEEIRGDAPLPVPAPAVDGVSAPAEAKEKGFMALVDEHQAREKCSRGAAIQAVAQAHPQAHEKWLDGQREKSRK